MPIDIMMMMVVVIVFVMMIMAVVMVVPVLPVAFGLAIPKGSSPSQRRTSADLVSGL